MYIGTHSVHVRTSICRSWFGQLSQSLVTRITPCYCHHVLLLTCHHSSNKVCPLVRPHLSNANRGRRKGWSPMKQPLHCTAFILFHVAHSRSTHNVLHSPNKLNIHVSHMCHMYLGAHCWSWSRERRSSSVCTTLGTQGIPLWENPRGALQIANNTTYTLCSSACSQLDISSADGKKTIHTHLCSGACSWLFLRSPCQFDLLCWFVPPHLSQKLLHVAMRLYCSQLW